MDAAQAVLTWVNMQREIHNIGKPLDALPLGIRNDACDCVVSRALTAGPLWTMTNQHATRVYDQDCAPWPSGPPVATIGHASYVRDFIDRFDAGFHPEFDEASHS
jgi:hypothetical protein